MFRGDSLFRALRRVSSRCKNSKRAERLLCSALNASVKLSSRQVQVKLNGSFFYFHRRVRGYRRFSCVLC